MVSDRPHCTLFFKLSQVKSLRRPASSDFWVLNFLLKNNKLRTQSAEAGCLKLLSWPNFCFTVQSSGSVGLSVMPPVYSFRLQHDSWCAFWSGLSFLWITYYYLFTFSKQLHYPARQIHFNSKIDVLHRRYTYCLYEMHFNVILSSLIDLNHVTEPYNVWQAWLFCCCLQWRAAVSDISNKFNIYIYIWICCVLFVFSLKGTWQTHSQ